MLSLLRQIRRFGTSPNNAAISVSKNIINYSNNMNNNLALDYEQPVLVKLKAERNPDKLFNLFKANAHNRLLIENRFAFEDTVSRLAGAGRLDYIESLLEQQKALPQGRREGFVLRIIMLYGKAGMVKHSIDTFYNMHLYGCKQTVKSFNAALKVLTQMRDLVAIESFMNQVPVEFGLQIDVFSVNIVIEVFCRLGFAEKAYLAMVEMENTGGIMPDVYTYTILISAFYKINRPEIGNGLWNLMVRRGCYPNLATFNARVQFLVNMGRAWQANSLMGLMIQYLRINPDLVTYNLVIKGFCRAGYLEMAKRVFSSIREEPNLKIYQTMIHYLCKSGEFDLAYTFCKDSLKKNWFPSLDTICMLLKGLEKNGEIGKARYILSLTVKKVPPLSASQLQTLQSLLPRS